jgi:hypothetical protein
MTTDIKTQIRKSYDRYSGHNPWAYISDVRSKVTAPRELVDQALREMAEDGEWDFTPEMNQGLLNAMQRHGALRIGGEHKHLMSRRR